MARIPFVSRVGLTDYLSLGLAFAVLLLDPVLRIVAWVFPAALVDHLRFLLYPRFPRLFAGWGSDDTDETPASPTGTGKTGAGVTIPLVLQLKLNHIRDIVHHFGFPFQEHYVDSDGYRLGIHRIPAGPNRSSSLRSPARSSRPGSPATSLGTGGEYDQRTPTNGSSLPVLLRRPGTPISQAQPRPVVLLWHGFMMCSDVWVLDRVNSLAYMLVEEGYDVWLGNNRGNKYSYKHTTMSPQSEAFWNFSLDEYARDLSHTVDYILEQTKQPSLIYIGFSQGTAQLFAALSCNPKLNAKIRLACCLAPTGKPHDLRNSFVTSIVKSTPNFLYLLFGRKAAIPSVLFWQSMFTPKIWVRMLDFCMNKLFSWSLDEIQFKDKILLYQFLFSTASVKSVVHWFQIIRSRGFAMYDDDPSARPWGQHSLTHPPHAYPLKNIETPIALFYGAKDTLSDLPFLLGNLPRPVFVHKVQDYEHLDCLWATSAKDILFPAVLGVLRYYGDRHPDGSMAVAPRMHPTVSDEVIDRVMAYGIVPEDVVPTYEGGGGGGSGADRDDTGLGLDASDARSDSCDLDPDTTDLLNAVMAIPGIRERKEFVSPRGIPPLTLPAGAKHDVAVNGVAGGKIRKRVGKKIVAGLNGRPMGTDGSPDSPLSPPARGHGDRIVSPVGAGGGGDENQTDAD